MHRTEKLGLILMNTGSPDAPEVAPTRRYLRQFLSDPRVIDLSPLGRWLLLNLVILPFRPKQSAEAYRAIWTDQGSPLIVNSEDFAEGLRAKLPEVEIEIGMAYGKPTIPDMIDRLLSRGVTRLVVAPMFPQYASATYGSVVELVYKTCAEKMNVPPIDVVPPYYDDPGYLDAWAAVAKPHLDAFKPDHILLSYHGLPERHIYKCDPTGAHCLKSKDCCDRYLEGNPDCYRAHCVATTKGIVERLGLGPEDYTLAFQSKLGRDPWLTPATDTTVVEKAKSGVNRLAVLSPAFVADCIETLEELGMQAKEEFEANGGEEFLLVPSLNAHDVWVDAFADLIRRRHVSAMV